MEVAYNGTQNDKRSNQNAILVYIYNSIFGRQKTKHGLDHAEIYFHPESTCVDKIILAEI